MGHWTKETALKELELLTQEIAILTQSHSMSAEHTRWLVRTLQFFENVFGTSSIYYLSLKQLQWRQTGTFLIQAVDVQGALEYKHHQAYLRDLDAAKGLLLASHDELSTRSLEDVYNGHDSPAESSGILKVLAIAERKLRKIIRVVPTAKREIQDAFENLLIGADFDYSREAESIEYSSKKYIPDFTIARLNLAIEIKLSARADREKTIISEINDDILAYKQKYGNILFIIYDTGFIRDIDRFIGHFEENDGVVVRVIKH